MYLKSIEVQGFKSFAKKLVFEFHNGITGIVGPNGSGKSNVADAVRWVLGEQSAKQLRGSSMQDVIFSGTEMRKPQSYAYVALTISNEDHKLNLPYEEVQVARRVYRSGESEYLLNGVTCRLRDVQELFFDTGIGKEGYSIIGQGQIDKILSGKPEERRELFDEAAGIVKFKKRKAAAEKNLETERQNLLRVQDILTELEKQVGPLEEQSKKAKEFLQLKEELKQFEVGLFCMDYETLQQETEEIEKNLSHTKEELEQAKADKEKSRSEYDSVESAIAEFDRSVEKKKEKVNQDKLLITNFEGEIRITKEKISSAAQGKEYYKERTDALEESKQAPQAHFASYPASQKEALLELEKITDEEKSLSSQMEQLEKAILEDEIELNEQNEQIMDSMNASSLIPVLKKEAKSMLEQNKIRKAELNQKILANKTQYSSAEEEMKREEELLKAAKKELDSAYVAKKELLRNADIKRQDILSLQKKQQEKQKNYHIIDSKLETVKNMAERYEGYSQSIRRVMEQKKQEPGVLGVVADIIRVKEKYITAVETALGGNIQNIVTEDEHVAKRMIQYLKKNRLGRATFLPLTTVTPKKEKPFRDEILEEDGVLGNVASKVDCDEKYNLIIEYLLGRFLLVDTIDHAMQISKKYQYRVRIVTLEGELFHPGGSLSGGTFKNNSNLLGRRKEQEALEKEKQTLESAIASVKGEIQTAQKQVENFVKDANAKEETVKELELKKNTAQIKYEQAVSVKEQKEKEYRAIANDGKEIENQKALIEDSLSRIDSDLELSKQKEEQAKNVKNKWSYKRKFLKTA